MCKTALALGTFDGLHIAHKKVLSLAEGCERKIAITFDVPPAMVLTQKCELIISNSKKEDMLAKLGFGIQTLDFPLVRTVEPTEFLKGLLEKYNPTRICCGFNYRFGRNGGGDITLLRNFCSANGIELCVANEVEALGDRVSSSRIRELIQNGDVARANELLGYRFSVEGVVAHGDGRGRKMSHPTVNFPYPEDIVQARHGVYSARCFIDGKEYRAVTYIGNRPTYSLSSCICETNILDFSGDLYGKELCVELCRFLRDDRKFSSLDELKKQIELDIKIASEN